MTDDRDDDFSSFGIACRAFAPMRISALDRLSLYRAIIAYLRAEAQACQPVYVDGFLRRAAELEVDLLREKAG